MEFRAVLFLIEYFFFVSLNFLTAEQANMGIIGASATAPQTASYEDVH